MTYFQSETFRPPTARLTTGMMMLFTSPVTILLNALPMTTAVARSTMLPLEMNFLKSDQNPIVNPAFSK